MKVICIILLIISTAYGQLRTPQSTWSSLEKVSPLNDKNYFKVMDKNAKKLKNLSAKKPRVQKKLSQLKIVGLKTTLNSYAQGRKFYIPEKMEIRDPLADGLNSVVPGYIPPSQSEVEVMKFFGDKMIQNWLQSAAVKNSTFGKAANSVENAMKVEASFTSAPQSPGGKVIDHRFSFQYMALQSQARMEYNGWTQARVRHDSKISETSIELSEKIFSNKDLVLNHTKNPVENRSSLGLRWSW